jgi:hypothetical protein
VTGFVPQGVQECQILFSPFGQKPQRHSEIELHIEADAPSSKKHLAQCTRRMAPLFPLAVSRLRFQDATDDHGIEKVLML